MPRSKARKAPRAACRVPREASNGLGKALRAIDCTEESDWKRPIEEEQIRPLDYYLTVTARPKATVI
jgi:hypothetical protein